MISLFILRETSASLKDKFTCNKRKRKINTKKMVIKKPILFVHYKIFLPAAMIKW